MSENKIILPDELKEKGWTKSILDENGEVDMKKVFSKIDGQETLLGKRHVPGKDATDDEWKEFAKKVVEPYSDDDYSSVLNDLDSKAEVLALAKEQGLTPKQTAKMVELWKAEQAKTIAKKYDEATFKTKAREMLTETEYKKAETVLKKLGKWDETVAASNDEALRNLLVAGKIGAEYDVDDKPGKLGGDPNGTQGNGKGANNQEYVNRIFELRNSGKSHEEALKQAKAEFSVTD